MFELVRVFSRPALAHAAAAVLVLGFGAQSVCAKPPSWAPAHGYRHKQEAGHRDVQHAAETYIEGGRCNREALGKVIGGVIGGVAGSEIGKGDGKTAATVVGVIVGYVIGGKIGRSMDEADARCTGQVLEHGEDRRPVRWVNPDTGAEYVVTPTRTYKADGRQCREFRTQTTVGGEIRKVYGTACRQADGSWKMVN
ncbi:MAG: glycine zipper 2TM domain-containing protein [Gammaproteobacteria bacterium]|nr:glycine zipper 2TM domain-containing protein [Gammaproteobacteria bacterium]NIR98266.1 glycine zipper 2TM domain-containing protein [Gammaproteobacteria bacterium]NIT63941.1 glycine zipper 2TM domain-containing protein [Gammaproteobacteria bacterium]NIV20939.1 glycine zipper 2TM domain-containing protein [Gammaproteobacteria bacterium]NIX10231.1 glycine zipper 2TM domain-containing protein [Gammaproteobacteria bacterium]